MTVHMKNRVLNEPLRDEFLKARECGVTLNQICRVLAEECDSRFMRKWNDRPYPPYGDTTRLQFILGLKKTSKGKYLVTIRVDYAHIICRALDISYDALYGGHVIEEFEPIWCSCGEELVKNDVMCGWCKEEMLGIAS